MGTFPAVKFAVLSVCLVAVALPATAQSNYQVVSLSNPGAITGTVKWSGALPRIPSFTINKDREICDPESHKTRKTGAPDRRANGWCRQYRGIPEKYFQRKSDKPPRTQTLPGPEGLSLRAPHSESSVGLTLSVGKWWDDEAVDERLWVFLRVWPEEHQYRMRLLDPTLSHHRNYKALGKPLDRESALANPLRNDFFAVADGIVENDPAVTSYLDTVTVDVARWQEARSRQPEGD